MGIQPSPRVVLHFFVVRSARIELAPGRYRNMRLACREFRGIKIRDLLQIYFRVFSCVRSTATKGDFHTAHRGVPPFLVGHLLLAPVRVVVAVGSGGEKRGLRRGVRGACRHLLYERRTGLVVEGVSCGEVHFLGVRLVFGCAHLVGDRGNGLAEAERVGSVETVLQVMGGVVARLWADVGATGTELAETDTDQVVVFGDYVDFRVGQGTFF